MPDNSITIGATVNVADLQAGMSAAGEVTREAVDKLLTDFQEASTGTARAVAKISEDTRVAAVEVDASWQEVARATLAYTSALREVSAATFLARKAGEDDAAAVNLLAAAKQKAAVASLELAAAQKETAASAVIESLSLKELAASASEIFEKFTGGLLGAGLLGGIFGHLANEAVAFSLQMRNLSGVTGISESTLAGLHDRVKEVGVDFDGVAASLGKLVKSQQDAVDGSAKQITGFNKIGISVNELRSLSPEELLFRVAAGFQSIGSTAEKNAAAVDIMGKGGRVALEAFQAGGPAFREWVEEAAKISKISDENTAAAFKWKAVTEQLSVAMRGFALDVLPSVVSAFPSLVAAFEGILAPIKTVIDAFVTFTLAFWEAEVGMAKVISDIVHANFKAIVSDAAEAKDRIVAVMKSGGQDIADAWTKDGDTAIKAFGGIKVPPKPNAGPDDKPGAGGKDSRLTDWKAELQAKKDDEDGFHQLSKDDEAAFWQLKLDTVKSGTKLYAEVLHEVRDAERAADKDALKDSEANLDKRLAATKAGSAERVALLVEEVNHLKSIHADETAAFERREVQLIAATRERTDQQNKSALDAERLKAEATHRGTAANIASWQAFVEKARELYGQDSDQYRQALARKTEADNAYAQSRVRIADIQNESDIAHDNADLQMRRQHLEALEQLGLITAREKLAREGQLLEEEYRAELSAVNRKIALYGKDTEAYARAIAERRKLEDKHAVDTARLNTQVATESRRPYEEFFAKINSGFQSAINGMITGTQTFARGMQNIFRSLVTDIIDQFTRMALKWFETHVIMAAISKIFGIDDGSNAATAKKVAQSKIAIEADAGQGSADVFVQAIEGIPFPANLGAAPALAALTHAEITALGSFHLGGIALDEQLAVLKRNEMVLPPALSSGFQKMFGAGGGDRFAAGSSEDDRRGHSETHNHFNLPTHISNLSALDGASVRAALEEHGDLIGKIAVKHVQRHFRSNGVER